MEGNVQTEYASLSGKIHTLVIDKSLSISGACADAQATGKEIERLESISEEAKENYEDAKAAYEEIVGSMEEISRVDAYTKEETLSPSTKTALGLSEDAVPDDAFAQFGLHWWKRRTESIGYSLGMVDRGYVSFNVSVNDNGQVYYTYFDSISLNPTTGEVTISAPTTYYNGYTNIDSFSVLAKKYFVHGKEYTNGSTIYYTDSGAADSLYDGSAAYSKIRCSECVIKQNTTVGEYEYVSSPDRNAYPDSGTEGIFSYQYLGVPFENAREGAKVATGSYVGTGTYGKNNPNSLTFEFSPKLVYIAHTSEYYSHMTVLIGCTRATGYFYTNGIDYSEISWSDGGKTLSWYSTGNALYQLNNGRNTYYYIAIG